MISGITVSKVGFLNQCTMGIVNLFTRAPAQSVDIVVGMILALINNVGHDSRRRIIGKIFFTIGSIHPVHRVNLLRRIVVESVKCGARYDSRIRLGRPSVGVREGRRIATEVGHLLQCHRGIDIELEAFRAKIAVADCQTLEGHNLRFTNVTTGLGKGRQGYDFGIAEGIGSRKASCVLDCIDTRTICLQQSILTDLNVNRGIISKCCRIRSTMVIRHCDRCDVSRRSTLNVVAHAAHVVQLGVVRDVRKRVLIFQWIGNRGNIHVCPSFGWRSL